MSLPDMTIRTERLTLRPFREADREPLKRLLDGMDARSLFETGGRRLTAARLAARMIRDAVPAKTGEAPLRLNLAILPRGGRSPIGGVTLACDEAGTGEIGLCVERGARGNGYASESLRALIAFGFNRLGLHRITGTCQADNRQSIRLMENAGMRFQCRLRTDVSGSRSAGSRVYAIRRPDAQPPPFAPPLKL